MLTKTEWLDWVEASADRLQQRYRDAWTRLPYGPRHASRQGSKREDGAPEPKRWSAIHAEIDREPREVVVHLELPEPHTAEAAVRVIGSTLSIAVLRRGSNIANAPIEDCYRRAIPLPPQVNPESAVHKVHGDELVIRLQPAAPPSRPSRAKSTTTRRTRPKATKPSADNVTEIKRSKRVEAARV